MFLSKILLSFILLISSGIDKHEQENKNKTIKYVKNSKENNNTKTQLSNNRAERSDKATCPPESEYMSEKNDSQQDRSDTKIHQRDSQKKNRDGAKKKYELNEILDTARDMIESVEQPLDKAAHAGADMFSVVKHSSYILHYINTLTYVLNQKVSERKWMILINLLLTLIFLFAYAVLTRFLMNFADDYIDMNELMFSTARWTLAYILVYSVVHIMKWYPSVMSIMNCLVTFAAATDMLDIVTLMLQEKYKQYNFFINKLFWLVQSMITAFSIIFTLCYFIELFTMDKIIFLGASQLFALSTMCFVIVFLFSVKERVGKLISRYIKQKQRQTISFKKDITELLFFNVLNFAIDIWFWLILFFIILMTLLFFISLKFLTLLFKVTVIMCLAWMYYVAMRVLKGAFLLFIKEHTLYQRYIVHRLLDRVFPTLKLILGFILICICIFIFNFTTRNVIYDILISRPCQLAYLITSLWLCVQFFIFIAEYYTFIVAYPVSLLTKNPITRIAGYFFRIAAGITAIMIAIHWLGFEVRDWTQNVTVLFAGISFIFQTSIRDTVNGALLAIDNTIELGDIIDIDGQLGIVEALTLFSVKIRTENGMLLTVRYSDIGKLGNKSRSYCFAIINASVAYENSLDDVIRALHDVYGDIKNGHQLGKKILSPLEIRGVTKLNGDEIVMQCRFKTKPRFDMPITRLFYIYLKHKFDQYDIKVSDPRLIISEDTLEDHVTRHKRNRKLKEPVYDKKIDDK